MSDCAAVAVIRQIGDEYELGCDLWAGHKPPIHWDETAGIHWFRIEEQPGYEPGTSLAYEPANG